MANQRERLNAAVIQAVAAGGYSATTIAQITSAAGLSRRTFYEHFSNKEDCFAAAHEVAFVELCETITAAPSRSTQWPLQVRSALAALLDLLAAKPELASFYLIDSLRAGDRIAERHHRAMQELIGLLLAPVPQPERPVQPSATLEQTLAGGLSGLIVRKINAGEGAGLSQLLPALTETLLRPFLGDEQSRRIAGRDQSTSA